jgi:cell wall-associated NlpC family hydrolase
VVKRLGVVFMALAGLIASFLVVAASASATAHPIGYIESARQLTTTHTLTVSGWAYDENRPGRSIVVDVWVDGVHTNHVKADISRKDVAARKHITGKHGFAVTVGRPRAAKVVTVNAHWANTPSRTTTVSTRAITQVKPPATTAGARIIAQAKKYVGGRYVEDGSTPSGFDCSGYTAYAYLHAHVATLPHNADAQRTAAHMHPIPRSQARAGDLIFYYSGSYAYHVAIYAGGDMQYAAATPADGIVYQHIWSSDISFGTDWH